MLENSFKTSPLSPSNSWLSSRLSSQPRAKSPLSPPWHSPAAMMEGCNCEKIRGRQW